MNPVIELARQLQAESVNGLRIRYRELFGEPTNSRNRDFLIKRIVWRTQALAEGGLSAEALKRAGELANTADLRIRPTREVKAAVDSVTGRTSVYRFPAGGDGRLPPPGTVLSRAYRGRMIRVMVLDAGFEYEGRTHKSLTAIAREITGTRWNGFDFFRLNGKGAGHE